MSASEYWFILIFFCRIGTFYSPLLPLIQVIKLWILFYVKRVCALLYSRTSSDFVTNSYDESWDSSCENRESLSITNEYQFKKKTRRPKLKMLGPLCNQTVNLETDAKTLHYSLLKLKRSPSIKHNKDWNKYASSSNSHRNDTNSILYQIFASCWMYAMICFVSLGIFLHHRQRTQR